MNEYQEMATKWSKDWRNLRYSNAEPDSKPSDVDNSLSKTLMPSMNPDAAVTVSEITTPFEADVVKDNTEPAPNESKPKPKAMTPATLEQDYWEIVEGQCQEIDVDYGNDVDTTEIGSGFPVSERGRSVNSSNFLAKEPEENLPEPKFGTEEYYKETYWNLNNIPNSKNSVLRHVKVGINGINVPWLYFGCLFSTFCWHNEDNHMYSINYHHRGAPKQ